MKRLKFLSTVSLEGKPIWYKDCVYEVVREQDERYDLVSEDLTLRGIDKKCENIYYRVIEDKADSISQVQKVASEHKEEYKEEHNSEKVNSENIKSNKKNKSKKKRN